MVSSVSRGLSRSEAQARAMRVKLVLTDCDGVLTDGGVYYSASGEELKCFSMRDGKGVERARNAGIDTVIVTGERSSSVRARGEKLGIEVHLGIEPKAPFVLELLAKRGLTRAEVAFIGDDVNDLGALALVREAGLAGAPADAQSAVRAAVHRVTEAQGGKGAFREFVEWLLELRASHESGDSPERESPRSAL